MRAKGLVYLILGIVLIAVSFLMLGNHDVAAIIGALVMGIGGASVVASLNYQFGHKPRMQ